MRHVRRLSRVTKTWACSRGAPALACTGSCRDCAGFVRDPESPYAITVPGALSEVAFMLKDTKRFPETDGWGYVTFEYDPASETFKPSTNDPSVARTSCHECHTRGAKDRDFVYTDYAKR